MWLLAVVAICCNLLHSTVAQPFPPIVNITGLGSVQGSIGYTAWTNRTIYQFQGIHFAEAPTGALRFQVNSSSMVGIVNIEDLPLEASGEARRVGWNLGRIATRHSLPPNIGRLCQRSGRGLPDGVSLLQ
uniref:(northern house mosquito) hypothetical protein n=1 Tax=Culex pipiens TaxID=7175 RepID=A0A8D8I846_CULPI